MDNGQARTRRAITAAVIGNVLEWYDFAVYAFVPVIIARKFFPQGDEVTALRHHGQYRGARVPAHQPGL